MLNYRIRSEEGLMLETSAFYIFQRGNSTCLIKPNLSNYFDLFQLQKHSESALFLCISKVLSFAAFVMFFLSFLVAEIV